MSKQVYLIFLAFVSLNYCSSESVVVNDGHECPIPKSSNYSPTSPVKTSTFSCSKCTYVVPEKKYTTDGAKLGIKPGDFICLDAAIKYGPLKFINLKGLPGNPITIVNCGGRVEIEVQSDARLIMRTENSQYFRITSIGDSSSPYGIRLSALPGARGSGLTLDNLSSNFEIDHLEIFNTSFAGIMAKTDPSCNDTTIRGHFTMRDISLHDNYIHDTGGEGFYLGNSYYDKGVKRDCGIRYPHEIHNIKVFNNIIKNPGWEAIQLGCATQGAEVYNNTIENYGAKNIPNQRGGIQLGGGTGGLCYNNKIINGNGVGLVVMGIGDNVVFNNIIANAGLVGIFCDDPATTCDGFKFINNTIINPKKDAIIIYADNVKLNVIANNIIVNPGSFGDYNSIFSDRDIAYVHKLNDNVKIDMSNNYFTMDINDLKFKDPANFDFSLSPSSPAINAGRNVSNFFIDYDLSGRSRTVGANVDIGAYEYVE